MVEDDVLREVRAARDAYAKSFNYDVRVMVADLRGRDAASDWPVVRRSSRRPSAIVAPAVATGEILQPTSGG